MYYPLYRTQRKLVKILNKYIYIIGILVFFLASCAQYPEANSIKVKKSVIVEEILTSKVETFVRALYNNDTDTLNKLTINQAKTEINTNFSSIVEGKQFKDFQYITFEKQEDQYTAIARIQNKPINPNHVDFTLHIVFIKLKNQWMISEVYYDA
ncbi:MAG: hypothetical protein K0S34_494 [Bacillales bacterium]|jgi:hypothetical protein|nr:hypothetical protein [Bacillales bacterium]